MLLQPNSFERRPLATSGDRRPQRLYLCIGEALTAWEIAEEAFASLFNMVVSPSRSSFAVRFAYGTLVAAKARHEMIRKAAGVFFQRFPSQHLHEELSQLLRNYADAGGRRNEIAHGIVAGHATDRVNKRAFDGYFLGPSHWTAGKRGVDLTPDYLYSSEMVRDLTRKFNLLRCDALRLTKEIENHFLASPERLRNRF